MYHGGFQGASLTPEALLWGRGDGAPAWDFLKNALGDSNVQPSPRNPALDQQAGVQASRSVVLKE